MSRFATVALAALLAFAHVDSSAQGVQTGSVTGVVRDATGLVLARATVRAESPSQQGARVTRFGPVRSGLEDQFMRALNEAGRHVGAEMSG